MPDIPDPFPELTELGYSGRGVTPDGGILVEIPSDEMGPFLSWLRERAEEADIENTVRGEER